MPRRIRNVPKRSARRNPREDRNGPQLPDFIKDQPRRRQQPEEHMRYERVEILPRNLAQERYLELLEDEYNSIVIATGPAGTGKSLLCTLYAIKQLQNDDIKKIIITRPAVGVDEEEHGFLPGSLTEKLMPWAKPIVDIFEEYYSLSTINKMLENNILEFTPISMVRGRTFKNSIVIFDEAQNSLPTAMKAVLTRIGDGSRMFVTGDIEQHDRGYAVNGLKDFIDRLKIYKSSMIAHCEFDIQDVERHPCVAEVLNIYK